MVVTVPEAQAVIKPDDFGIGRAALKTLAPEPAAKMLPVACIGATGVRRAGRFDIVPGPVRGIFEVGRHL